MHRGRALFTLMAPLALAACSKQAQPVTGAAGSPKAEQAQALVESYVDALLTRQPELGRSLGLHEYDGKVSRISEEAVSAAIDEARKYLAAVEALDLATLPDPVKLDLQVSSLHAQQTIFELETRQQHRRIMSYGGLFDVNDYMSRDYAPAGARVSKMLDSLEGMTAQVDAILALQLPTQPRTHLETAKKIYAGMKEYYQGDLLTAAQPALDADAALKARYDAAVPKAIAAMDKILAWIDGPGLAQANDDYAIGEAAFLEMLRVNEGLDTSIANLEKMALADWKTNHEGFVATAKALHPDLPPQKAMEMIAADRLPADQVIPAAEKQLIELAGFIESNEIVTIGSDLRAAVKITPPFMRWNSAFLDMGGPFEQAEGSFYYLSPPDPSWPKEVQQAYLPYEGDLLSTSVHEVYPGHFVQALHQRRAPTRAQKIFDSYAFVEGWAHYAEQMMFDAGFAAGDHKRKLGQLSNALLRNCRFIAAIGLHIKGMTVAEAQKLFEEQCFIDPGNAEQQAYRGTFDPGYFSYTLGKLQILELREKFFAKRGTTNLREFHDWLLSHGNAPVALIAERL